MCTGAPVHWCKKRNSMADCPLNLKASSRRDHTTSVHISLANSSHMTTPNSKRTGNKILQQTRKNSRNIWWIALVANHTRYSYNKRPKVFLTAFRFSWVLITLKRDFIELGAHFNSISLMLHPRTQAILNVVMSLLYWKILAVSTIQLRDDSSMKEKVCLPREKVSLWHWSALMNPLMWNFWPNRQWLHSSETLLIIHEICAVRCQCSLRRLAAKQLLLSIT